MTFVTGVSSNAAVANFVELDGNAEPGLAAGTDWNALYPAGAGATPAPVKPPLFINDDLANDRVFTGGGSKDDLDITQWRHTVGSVPDKDEITNAYAVAYRDGLEGDLNLYFGLDRFAQNGDANVGFWFLKSQAPTTLPADGTFGIEHQNGDILVLSEFSNGGTVPLIRVLEWRPGPGAINGTLNELFTSTEPNCATSALNACGIANTADAPVSWSYTPKRGESGTVPTGGFFEGGINLTQLLQAEGGSTAPVAQCFSTFLAETRASTSVDATLKDFALGAFDLCSATINISPLTDTNGITENHTFTVTATYTVAGGTPQPISNGHVDVTLTKNPTTMTTTTPTGTCDVVTTFPSPAHTTDNLDNDGKCTVSLSSSSAGTITAVAKVTANLGTTADPYVVTAQTGTTGNSANAVKTYVDGTVNWEKRASSTTGALLGGATFQLCRVADWNSNSTPPGLEYPSGISAANETTVACPAGRTTVVLDDTSTSDDPDVAPDTNNAAGQFTVEDLPLGRYRILETVPPTGYSGDTTPQFVVIDTTTTSATAASPFVNLPLYKLIVITCDTADNLIDSEVTLNSVKKQTLTNADTLPDGVSRAELCGLSGANYGNLTGGTYSPSVELPDVAPLHTP